MMGDEMGIDAVMAVALKKDADVDSINKRFRETFTPCDTLVEPGGYLILRKAPNYMECFDYENTYDVNTGYHRYYGIGYERGPVFRILLQLEWLRNQPETVEVYYGGDCSDSPSAWSWQHSLELISHFIKVGDTPYRGKVDEKVWIKS